MSTLDGMFPLEELSASYVALGQLERAIEALQKHLAVLRAAGSLWRQQLRDLEVQGIKDDDQRRLMCSYLIKQCDEYEKRAGQRMKELLLMRPNG
jgi:hypothetical protein